MTKHIIQLKDLSFQYSEESNLVINDLSLDVEQGEWLAIIGPNGSGKSTLAKIINGLLAPTSGEVIVDNLTLSEETVWNIRSRVGMVFQNPDNQFVGVTVEDDVAFGLENNGVPREEMVPRVHDALEAVRMEDFLKKEPARLSGGQKQRVALASVIALRPQIIILDEATSMLDPIGRKEMMEAIEMLKDQFDLTVLSITHDIDEANQADRIVVFNDGKVQNVGTPQEIFSMGDQLIQLGLDIPFNYKITNDLKSRGYNLSDTYMDEEATMQWIVQYNLNK